MNKINALYVSLVALVVAIIALVMCIVCCNRGGNAGSSADVEKILADKPELIANALQLAEQKRIEAAQQAAAQAIKDNMDALTNNPNDGILGNPDGKVVLVEFFDFSCGYCHKIYPAIKNVVAKNPDLKVVAKSMTFVAPVSKYAAKAALAAKEQGKFEAVYKGLFEAQGPLTEAKVDEIAVLSGVDLEQMKADMNSPKIEKALNDMSDLAGKINVTGVPTLVLNGKVVQTLDEAVIQSEIDVARNN